MRDQKPVVLTRYGQGLVDQMMDENPRLDIALVREYIEWSENGVLATEGVTMEDLSGYPPHPVAAEALTMFPDWIFQEIYGGIQCLD